MVINLNNIKSQFNVIEQCFKYLKMVLNHNNKSPFSNYQYVRHDLITKFYTLYNECELSLLKVNK
jgi:hypothetical protein